MTNVTINTTLKLTEEVFKAALEAADKLDVSNLEPSGFEKALAAASNLDVSNLGPSPFKKALAAAENAGPQVPKV